MPPTLGGDDKHALPTPGSRFPGLHWEGVSWTPPAMDTMRLDGHGQNPDDPDSTEDNRKDHVLTVAW